MATAGRTALTTNSRLTVLVLPAASATRSSNTCAPSDSPERECVVAELQAPKPPSIRQERVSGCDGSVAENVKLTVLEVTISSSFGPPVMSTAGAVPSTLKLRVTTVSLPALSTALTL